MSEMITTIVVAYPVTQEGIREQLQPLSALTEYQPVVKAIATCRGLRVQIEERRKFLKADSLAYGRAVDSIAAQLTSLVTEYEEPLKARKQAVDDEKARAKAGKEKAERDARDAELRAERAAEEERLRAQREAQELALAEQRAELARERAKAQAEAAAAREQLEAERRVAAQERSAAEAERRAQAAELAALARAREEQAERERLAAEAEAQRVAKLESDRKLEERLAALQPDVIKLETYAGAILKLAGSPPKVGRELEAALLSALVFMRQAALAITDELEADL